MGDASKKSKLSHTFFTLEFFSKKKFYILNVRNFVLFSSCATIPQT
jgi:hypothetical protein